MDRRMQNSGSQSAFSPQFTQFSTEFGRVPNQNSHQIRSQNTGSSSQNLHSATTTTNNDNHLHKGQGTSPASNSESELTMLGGAAPSSTAEGHDQTHQDVSPTSSVLDYDTFWQLQQQLGVAPLRDNLNYAVAQNQTVAAQGLGLEPYNEPMYVYNDYPYMNNHYEDGGAQRDHDTHPTHYVQPPPQEMFYEPMPFNPELQHSSPMHSVPQNTLQQQHVEGYTSPMSPNQSSEYIPASSLGHAAFPTDPSLTQSDPIQHSQHAHMSRTHPQPVGGQPPMRQPFTAASTEFRAPYSNSGHSMIPTFERSAHPRRGPGSPPKLSSQPFPASATVPSVPHVKRRESVAVRPKKESRKSRAKKRPRRSDQESDSDSDDDDGRKIGIGPDGLPVRKAGACTHCKKLKMRCEFENPTDTVCKRCRNTRHQCIVEGRKPRTQPNKREFLLAQIRQRDQIIKKLLEAIHNPSSITTRSEPSGDASNQTNYQPAPEVVAWLEDAQASVRAGIRPYVLDRWADRDPDDAGSDFFPDDDDDGNGPLHDNFLSVPDHNIYNDREKLHSLPDRLAPFGLIANLSISSTRSRSRSRSRSKSESSYGKKSKDKNGNDGTDSDDIGVANDGYFLPATNFDLRAALLVNQPPEIMVHGLVNPEDVDNLFQIFFDKMNPFLSILDPKLHTPSSTFSRCPFLFTVICAVSSRYYTLKSSIYPIAMHFAKQAAAKNLIDGWKCVEQCQAYLLMSLYSMPARKWEDDRSWLYLGVAIRIATDLNLHHPTQTRKFESEIHEREILNRTRTWMILFNLDRSASTQLGKPSTIREDYIIYQADKWFRSSPYNHPYDIHLCSYSELLRMVARFHDKIYNGPLGLKPGVDLQQVTLLFDAELNEFKERTANSFNTYSDPSDAGAAFRCKLLPFLVDYSRLVMFSFGFQKAFQQGLRDDDAFLIKVLDTAMNVLKCFVNSLAPSGYMRYSPDGHFVFVSFASAFLIKLLRTGMINEIQREKTVHAIQLLIDTLSSPEIAIDEKHTPKLYARFLRSLLSEQLADDEDGAVSRDTPGTEGSSNRHRSSDGNERSSTETDNKTQKWDSYSPQSQVPESEGQHGHQTPAISLEYAPIGGEPHVQVLQDSTGRPPQSDQDYRNLDPLSNIVANYDERFSNVSGNIGEQCNEEDISTQHGDLTGGNGQGSSGQLNQGDKLAFMHLLSNPQFFDHMMMPPYNPAQWSQASGDLDTQTSQLQDLSSVIHQPYPPEPPQSYPTD